MGRKRSTALKGSKGALGRQEKEIKMRELLDFLVKNITGIEDYEVEEQVDDSFTRYEIKTDPDEAGLIIGKRGKTVKTIRNLLKVKATLENKGVAVSVEGKE